MKCTREMIEKMKKDYIFEPHNYEIESDFDGLRMSVDYDLIAKNDFDKRITIKNDLDKRMDFINRNSWYGLSPYVEMENLMRRYCEDDVKACMNAVFGIRNAKPKITKVIYNYPATIVFWSDGTKTVVKCDGDVWDEEKGLAMAIAKKFMGTNESKSNFNDIFKKWAKPDIDTEKESGLAAYVKNKLRNAFPLENGDTIEDDALSLAKICEIQTQQVLQSYLEDCNLMGDDGK